MSDARKAHGAREKLKAAREKAAGDKELLAMRDDERLTYERIGVRLGGISRVAARNRILRARARQKNLAAIPSGGLQNGGNGVT